MKIFLAILFLASFLALQLMIGGTRLCFLLPACAGFGLTAVLAILTRKKWGASASGVCVGSALVLIGYIVIRGAFSPYPYLARMDLFMVGGGLIAYLLAAFVFTGQRERLVILSLIALIGVAHVAVGVYQFRGEMNWMPFGLMRANYGWRASGFYICPNHTAGYLEVVAVMLASITLWGRISVTLRLLFGYVTLVLLLGIVLTGSRGGWLSTGVAFTFFLIGSLILIGYAWRGRLITVGASLVLLIAGTFGGILYGINHSSDMKRRLDNLIDRENMRVYMWESGMKQYALNPVFGTGSGTFLRYGRELRPEGSYYNDPIHVHNDYIHLLAEYGLMGAVLMGFFLVLHAGYGVRSFFWLLKNRMRDRGVHVSNAAAVQLGALAGVMAIAAHSVVDFNMHIPGNVVLMGFLFGLLANPGVGMKLTGNLKEQVGRQLWGKVALCLCGIALLIPMPWLLPSEVYAEKARVRLRDEQYREAITYAKRGLLYDTTNPELYDHIGEARLYWALSVESPMINYSLYAGAADALEQGLHYFPDDFWRLLSLGQALDGIKQYDKAEKAYLRAIALDRYVPEGWSLLGYHYEEEGKDEQALDAYQTAMKYVPPSWAREALREVRERLKESQTQTK